MLRSLWLSDVVVMKKAACIVALLDYIKILFLLLLVTERNHRSVHLSENAKENIMTYLHIQIYFDSLID